ncbi:MAG: T9SS type A sorting domain-containing protein [Bacteroidetes bacterium]|nr:T9SS type A sorting domain-containing protein [Bacteroidota bacterium]
MKKIYLSMLAAFALNAGMNAQTACNNGRYSSDVYPTYTVTSGIAYGKNVTFSNTTQTLTLDFYEPVGDTAHFRPLIIWAHGGSFIGGSSTDADVVSLSQHFAKKGFVCASINYRLGFFPIDSVHAIPAVIRAVQDMKAAIRFFYKDRSTTNTYKIDTNNIFIGGSSAGAITALHTAYLDRTCEINPYVNAATLASMGGLDGASGNQCYSQKVKGVINLCGALAMYGWLEAGNIPLCSMHGTADGTVKYSRGVVNPGVALMYLDGSRMLKAQTDAVGVPHSFYTWYGADHVPYAGTSATQLQYMDTTVNFVRDYLIGRLACTDPALQAPNAPYGTATLYAYTPCTGNVSTPCDVGVHEYESTLVSEIYPNPSSSNIHVVISDQSASHTVVLTDLTGKTLQTVNSTSEDIIVERNNVAPGIYFLKISNDKGQMAVKKVIFN